MARSLEVMRALIDEVDRDLVECLARRLRLAREVGEYKAGCGLLARDAEREEQMVQRREIFARAFEIPAVLVEGVFGVILEHGREAQAAAPVGTNES